MQKDVSDESAVFVPALHARLEVDYQTLAQVDQNLQHVHGKHLPMQAALVYIRWYAHTHKHTMSCIYVHMHTNTHTLTCTCMNIAPYSSAVMRPF